MGSGRKGRGKKEELHELTGGISETSALQQWGVVESELLVVPGVGWHRGPQQQRHLVSLR